MGAYRYILLVFLQLLAADSSAQEAADGRPAYDVLIRGGRILDGTGNPWFRADVAIREGRIAAVDILAGSWALILGSGDNLLTSPSPRQGVVHRTLTVQVPAASGCGEWLTW